MTTLLSTIIEVDIPHQISTMATQQWFRTLIQQADPTLAQQLFDTEDRRPFTISPGFEPFRNYPAWLRITGTASSLNTLLTELIWPKLQNDGHLHLDGQEIPIRSVFYNTPLRFEARSVRQPQHWAASTNISALINQIMHNAQPPRQITLHFFTPTMLKSRGMILTMPHPPQLFLSLLRRWQWLTDIELHTDLVRFIKLMPYIADYRLHTENTETIGWTYDNTIVGSVGRMTLVLPHKKRVARALRADYSYLLNCVRLLAALSFFTGIGLHTAFGLGQTMPILK